MKGYFKLAAISTLSFIFKKATKFLFFKFTDPYLKWIQPELYILEVQIKIFCLERIKFTIFQPLPQSLELSSIAYRLFIHFCSRISKQSRIAPQESLAPLLVIMCKIVCSISCGALVSVAGAFNKENFQRYIARSKIKACLSLRQKTSLRPHTSFRSPSHSLYS